MHNLNRYILYFQQQMILHMLNFTYEEYVAAPTLQELHAQVCRRVMPKRFMCRQIPELGG